MGDAKQQTIQDALRKLTQYGFQECPKEVRNQSGRPCLYAFERPDDEGKVYYGCETEEDVFSLLSLVEASQEQYL